MTANGTEQHAIAAHKGTCASGCSLVIAVAEFLAAKDSLCAFCDGGMTDLPCRCFENEERKQIAEQIMRDALKANSEISSKKSMNANIK